MLSQYCPKSFDLGVFIYFIVIKNYFFIMDIYRDINDVVSGLKFGSTTKNRSKRSYLVSVGVFGEMRSIFLSEGSIFVIHDIPLSFPNA